MSKGYAITNWKRQTARRMPKAAKIAFAGGNDYRVSFKDLKYIKAPPDIPDQCPHQELYL